MYWVGLAVLGVGVGYIAGMFGIGGGWLLTPILTVAFKVPAPTAVGSTLCQQIGTSIGSYLKYRHYRHGEPRIDWLMMGGSLMGAHAGASALHALSRMALVRGVPVANVAIESLYVLLLGGTAVVTLLNLRGGPDLDRTEPGPLARLRLPPYVLLPHLGLRTSLPALAYIGFATGALSGLLGVGGGVALLPILVYGYGFSMRDAAGTGILLLFVTVVAGTAVSAWNGLVDLRIAFTVLAGSAVGAQFGARTTHRLSNRALKIAFFALLAAVTAMVLVHLVAGMIG